jgi:hypothetical protein
MESVIRQPLVINNKCTNHECDYVGICINKTCTLNGLVCYTCIYNSHSGHFKDCIPLNLWKVEIDSNKSTYEIVNANFEKILVKIKDLNHIIQNYFSELCEKLIIMKDNLDRNGILTLFQTDLPLFYKYQIQDNMYVITQKDINEIVDKLESCFIKEVEKQIAREFKKCSGTGGEVKRTETRLTSVSDNWSQSTSYYDAIGFKVMEELLLCGIGIYEATDTKTKMPIEVIIYEEDMKDNSKIFSQAIDLKDVDIKFENKLGDLMFNSEVRLKKGITYIIAKLNVKENPHCYYGKTPAVPIPPFELISWKDKSQSFRSGNYTDLSCGAFPYFIYK